MRKHSWFMAFIAVVSALGCGKEHKVAPKTPQSEPEQQERPSLQMHAELGVLDEGKVRETFEKVWRGPMTDCQKQGGEFVSGDTVVKMRVNHRGKVKWVYFSESNLGSQKAQDCMLQAIRDATWPIPRGGEDGLVEQHLPFADLAERPAVDWDPDRVAKAVEKGSDKIDECLRGSSGPFAVTVIVARSGKALSAGVAQPDENTSEQAECLAEVFTEFSYPSPGSWPAKVTVRIP